MTLSANELVSTTPGLGSQLRVFAKRIMPKTFAAGTGTLAKATPVSFNSNTAKWQVWGDPVASKVVRLTAAATTASDGTYTITTDGETTAALAHDANAAAIKAALVLLDQWTTSNVYVYDTDGGLASNNGYATIIFLNATPDVSFTNVDLTGLTHVLSTVAGAVGEISVITAASTTATDGTFTITVNGETTAALDHDTTPALIQAALEALGGINVGDVIVFDTLAAGLATNSGAAVILFTGNLTYTNPAVSFTLDLTGADHVLSTLVAGASAYDQNVIRGFVWPDDVALAAANEVLGNVLLEGSIHYDDIVLPAGETETDLKAALRDGPRALGLTIEGLDQVR